MHDVHHAIENLREITQIPDLDFNENGHAELIFNGTVSVDLIRIDDHTLELSTTLTQGRDYDLAAIQRLLSANYLGDAVGAGRIGLDLVTGRLVFCERVAVKTLDGWQFEERLLAFLKHVAFWRSEAAEIFLTGRSEHAGAAPADLADSLMIRI